MSPKFKSQSKRTAADPAEAKAAVLFQEAFTNHQKGQLAQAQEGYRQVLKIQARHFHALHFLSVIAAQTGNTAQAVELIGNAIKVNPDYADAHYHLGNALNDLNRPEAALASYHQAIALKPDHADAYYYRGNTLSQLRQFDEALASYCQAISLRPDYVEAHYQCGNILNDLKQSEAALVSYNRVIALRPNFALTYYNRGNALNDLKQFDAAVASYNQAIALKPDFIEAYNNRGNTQRQMGQFDAALASYQQASALKSDDAVSYYNCGLVLNDLKRFEAAVAAYSQAIALKPNYADAYNNRGNAQRDLKQPEAALASYRQAIALKPDYAEAYYNVGVALRDLKQTEAALASYHQAIAIKPDYIDAYCNRGNAYRDLKRFDEAVASYDYAIAIKPDYAKAHWYKSLLKLLLGDYDEGWRLYEWRWRTATFTNTVRYYQQPLWLGEQALIGKTLLIYGEQGLGDTLQFCRYVQMAQAQGAKVILAVPRELFTLMTTLKGNVTLIEQGHELPDFDLHCPVMSLPLAFKTAVSTIPAAVPYLYSSPEKQALWHKRLGAKTKLRVGLAWSGSSLHENDLNRSLPLALWASLLALPIEFHALQKDIRADDADFLSNHTTIQSHQDELLDFSDTAALIANMDLVIAVDTSVAHLAGALAKPVWLLLPFIPDFRWLLDRADTPWYPTARLFRQPVAGDWESVISAVVRESIAVAGATTSSGGAELNSEAIKTLIAGNRTAYIKHIHELQEAAQGLLVSIDAKDVEGLVDAGGKVEQVCEQCHSQFWYPGDNKPK